MNETLHLAQSELKKYNLSAELVLRKDLPSFEISAKANAVTIAAPSEVELLYGVYELAERLGGYCFFEPGNDRFDPARKVPEVADGIVVPARRPLLETRGFIQEFPFNDETPQLFDWMAKNKLNYLQVWMKYYDELSPELKTMAQVRGIVIESGHHNFNYWIPGRKYNKTNPEFFAEINGQRIVSSDGKAELLLSEQLCTTNKALRDEIVKNMLAYLDANPEIKTIAINPNDGFGWCECKECSKFYDKNDMGDFYSVSAHVYRAGRIYHDLVKYLAAQLHEKRPDVTLTFYAYVNYCAPSPGFTLEEGMSVFLATYWRCINHKIFEDCPINSHYADDIRKWVGVKHGGKANIYEYYMGINFYLSLPMVHHRDIFEEVKWYSDNGVDGVLTQFHLPHWTAYGANYYMFAKAARGENQEAAVGKMFSDLFGNDAAAADAFYAALKSFLLSAGECHIPYPHSLFSRTAAPQYQDLIKKAKELLALAPKDTFRQNIVAWMEYMARFKQLFNDYQEGKLTLEGVDAFEKWCGTLDGRRIVVLPRLASYLPALRDALKNGTRWLHFNIDWEDEYIKQHHKMWTGKEL